MSDATFRAAIKARLEAHGPGMGRVHDYERWSVDPGKFLYLFQDPATKKIFGWEIVRTKVRVQKATMAKKRMLHTYVVRGYYGLEDAAQTEKAINALVDALLLDFAAEPMAGADNESTPTATIETRLFGHVLCHAAEITLPDLGEIIAPPVEEDETDLTAVGLEYYLKPGDDVLDASDLVTVGT
ncbi:MAG: hypothetical protein HY911_04500 [Desulfobacterales bacterium]|nr:hypothetical protein [Desulfobacterales bacterium]